MASDISVAGYEGFADGLAQAMGCRFIPMERRTFPDGEVCPRLSGRPEGRVVLANRMKLPVDANGYLVETLLAASSLKGMGCDVWLAMPYFIYSRQDKSFREGEPLSARAVTDLLLRSGVSRFFTVSSHADRDKPMLSFSAMPAHNIDGYSLLGEELKQLNLASPLVIGADAGVEFAARRIADAIGCGHGCLSKERNLEDGGLKTTGSIEAEGKDVIIIDDIISSGGTMANAAKMARDAGAASVTAAAVHLTKAEAIEKLRPFADGIIATDTIETPVSQVSVIPLIAEKMREML